MAHTIVPNCFYNENLGFSTEFSVSRGGRFPIVTVISCTELIKIHSHQTFAKMMFVKFQPI